MYLYSIRLLPVQPIAILRAMLTSGWFVDAFLYFFESKGKVTRSFLCVCTLVIGGMFFIFISGVFPDYRGIEIRKPLSLSSLPIPPQKDTRPLAGNFWNIRGEFIRQEIPSGITSPILFSSQNMFQLFEDSVGLRTAKGVTPLVIKEMDETIAELFSTDTMLITSLGEPLNFEGVPLRWNIGKNLCEMTPQSIARRNQFLNSWMKLTTFSKSLVQQVEQYKEIVEKYSKKYNLSAELIYAIICVESSFNPAQISNRSAHGLMQIVPEMAGVEVKRWFGYSGLPTAEELLHPETNIKYGTSYLYLLMTRHLRPITNCLSREYCAIAAYNIGVGAMLKTFAVTPEEAFAIINTYTAAEVQEHLMQKLPAKQTRVFLERVLTFKESFTVLL